MVTSTGQGAAALPATAATLVAIPADDNAVVTRGSCASHSQSPANKAAGSCAITTRRPIDGAARTVYHAAAVFASNYLTTVLDAALRAYQAAGISEAVARELAQPLATETLANVFRLGPAAALSGPIARGDLATVARQEQALLDWDEATGRLYGALVPPTTDLARRKHGAT